MAGFGVSTANIVMAILFVVAVFYVSGIMAQDIAPSPAMDTGSGFIFPVSEFEDHDLSPFHSLVRHSVLGSCGAVIFRFLCCAMHYCYARSLQHLRNPQTVRISQSMPGECSSSLLAVSSNLFIGEVNILYVEKPYC
ncbi:hypothetical protein PTKIN_Ptkin06aG0088400 [Pterospermum kingtungense]